MDGSSAEPPFHLLLEADEVGVVATALNLLVDDEAHQQSIRDLARGALAGLEQAPGESGILSLRLTPQQMKITHTAVKLLFDDLQRGQAEERDVLRSVLDKLPDEHTMRAIALE